MLLKGGVGGKCVEEAKVGVGPILKGQAPMAPSSSSSSLGQEEPSCSELICPPGFENCIDEIGLSNCTIQQGTSMEIFECENSLVERNGIHQCCRESNGFRQKRFPKHLCLNQIQTT